MVFKHPSLSIALLGLVLVTLACNASGAGPLPAGTATPLPATDLPVEPVTPAPQQADFKGLTTAETNIRTGPSTDHDVLATLAAGLMIQLSGRTADKSWWQVVFPASPTGQAWIYAGNVQVTAGLNVDVLPVISVPPAPTRTPTVAPPTATSLPPTATRRVIPITPKPPVIQPPATAQPPASQAAFRADKVHLAQGECTTLRWDFDNIQAIYLNAGRGDEPVMGHGTRYICQDVTTVYNLKVIAGDNSVQRYTLTLMVTGACGSTPIISRFEAGKTEIKAGEQVALYWDVACAQGVFLKAGSGEREPVGGHDRREVAPRQTTTYKLIVIAADGTEIKRDLTITVVP